MSSAAFQCPDSGLVVVVDSDGTAHGDRDDWQELGASAECIADTEAWLERFRRALAQSIKARGRTFEAFADALRFCGGVVSDLYPLTWEREALECEHATLDRGRGRCDECGAELGEDDGGGVVDEGALAFVRRAMREEGQG